MKSFKDFMETKVIQDPKQLQAHIRDMWGGLNQAIYQISSTLFDAQRFPWLKNTAGLAELAQAVKQIEQVYKTGEPAFRTFVNAKIAPPQQSQQQPPQVW